MLRAARGRLESCEIMARCFGSFVTIRGSDPVDSFVTSGMEHRGLEMYLEPKQSTLRLIWPLRISICSRPIPLSVRSIQDHCSCIFSHHSKHLILNLYHSN